MKIERGVKLRELSTFKIGGMAKFFIKVESESDLMAALDWQKNNACKYFILGGGSNVLFADDGFDGLVIKLENKNLEIIDEGDTVSVKVGAGTRLSDLVKFCQEHSLSGLEWAAGIPGTVGGAIRGNAGAFGGEIKDSIVEVAYVDLAEEGCVFRNFSNANCDFGYRSSVFKSEKKFIIWEAFFSFVKGERRKIEEKVREILISRKSKQPPLGAYPSAGSVFKNPVASREVIAQFELDKGVTCKDNKVPAGWIIERSGLKGKRIGDAMVSEQQANFIVNMGSATTEEILMLISIIKQKARQNFGIQLEEEIQIVF